MTQLRLQDKVAFVTGGGTGIGAASFQAANPMSKESSVVRLLFCATKAATIRRPRPTAMIFTQRIALT